MPLEPADLKMIAIEDGFMKAAVGAKSSVSLGNVMPVRPGHGTMGRKIVVYANYFKVNVPKDLSLTRYNVEFTPEVKGKKLGRLFQLLLQLPEFAGVATDRASMIISSKPLGITIPHQVSITYLAEGQDEPLERAITYTARVITPLTFSVSDLVNFLSSTNPGPGYHQKAEIIQVMNAVFGSHPNAHSEVRSIGQNRHFSIERTERNRYNIKDLGGGLESLRGYFQSVRAATGGLLLNVNVTHGVFLQPELLSSLYPKLGSGDKRKLSQKLKLVRVRVMHLPVKKSKSGLEVPRVKTVFGLAQIGDGATEEKRPRIKVSGGGPQDVEFWLNAEPPSKAAPASIPGQKKVPTAGPSKMPTNAYITVFKYFQLKYPNIKLDARNPVVNVGNREHPSYLPAEVCCVLPGQVRRFLLCFEICC